MPYATSTRSRPSAPDELVAVPSAKPPVLGPTDEVAAMTLSGELAKEWHQFNSWWLWMLWSIGAVVTVLLAAVWHGTVP
jgi:small neutral amino acid transporter SnatA (MarC family)